MKKEEPFYPNMAQLAVERVKENLEKMRDSDVSLYAAAGFNGEVIGE